MHINKKINKNFFIYFSIFFTFLLIGIISFKDYGISIDEHFHHINGQHYYSFFKGLFFNDGEYLTYEELKNSFKAHHFKNPAIFDFIIVFLAETFEIKDTKNIYQLRHLSIFILFLVGLYYFYLILKKRFKNNFFIIS